jgi:hypothetical protein
MNEKLSPERLAEIRTRRDEGLECHDGYHVCETWVPEARQLLWSWSSIRGVGTCVENDVPALLAHIAAVEAERDLARDADISVTKQWLKVRAERDALAAKIAAVTALWGDWVCGGWDRPDDDLRDALGMTDEQQRAAIAQPKDGEQR